MNQRLKLAKILVRMRKKQRELAGEYTLLKQCADAVQELLDACEGTTSQAAEKYCERSIEDIRAVAPEFITAVEGN